MVHQTTFTPVEIMPDAFYQQQSTLPSILKRKGDVFEIVTDGALCVDDVVSEFFTNKQHKVKEVLESRKAKGDWSGKSYNGQTPTWNKVVICK